MIDHDELRWLALHVLDSVEWAPADIPLVWIHSGSAQINTTSERGLSGASGLSAVTT